MATTILVVDDEASVRELLRSALSEAGYEVVTASGPAQARAILATNPADLLLLDLSFPGESGASFLKELQQSRPALPVVVYSGVVTAELEKELIRAGAADVLNKTVDVTSLVRQIGTILAAKARMARTGARRPDRVLLVIDDDPSIRSLLKEVFAAKGYRVIEAAGGEEGVAAASRERPSVVLLDVMMPGLTGLDTLPKLLAACPGVGVVMATGQQDEATVREAIRQGAYGYVLKPFDLLYLELVVLSKLALAVGGR